MMKKRESLRKFTSEANILIDKSEFALAFDLLRRAVFLLFAQNVECREAKTQVITSLNRMFGLLHKQRNPPTALKLANFTYMVAKQLFPARDVILSRSLNNLAIALEHTKRTDEAITLHLRNLAIRLQILEADDDEISSTYNNLGICLYNKSMYLEAIRYYKKGLEKRLIRFGEGDFLTQSSLLNIANCYLRLGNLDRAALNCKRVIENAADPRGYITAFALNTLGLIWIQMGRIGAAKEAIIQSLEIKQSKFESGHPSIVNSMNALADICLSQKRYDEARKISLDCVEVLFHKFGPECYQLFHAYNSLGAICIHTGDFEESRSVLYKSISIVEKLNLPGKAFAVYVNLSELHVKLEEYHQALSYAQLALSRSVTGFDNSDPAIDPLPYISKAPFNILMVFENKISAFRGLSETENELKCQESALQTLLIACLWVGHFRREVVFESGYLQLMESASYLYRLGMSLCADLLDQPDLVRIVQRNLSKELSYQRLDLSAIDQILLDSDVSDLVYAFSEMGKATMLAIRMKGVLVDARGQIPEELLQEGRSLSNRMGQIRSSYLNTLANGKEVNQYKVKQKIELETEFIALVDTLKENYPDYFRDWYLSRHVPIDSIQQRLMDGEAMLHYSICGDTILIMAITRIEYVFRLVDKPQDYDAQVSSFVSSIRRAASDRYVNTAKGLYLLLIQPVEAVLKNIEKLIIVPEDVMLLIPFEALLTETAASGIGYGDLPYLLRDFEICYHYSAKLWFEGRGETKSLKELEESVLAFAPVFEGKSESTVKKSSEALAVRSVRIGGKSYQELKHSETELKGVGQLFQAHGGAADLHFHGQATLSKFKSKLADHKYLLIASHTHWSDGFDEEPGILFSPECKHQSDTDSIDHQCILTLSDIYNLQMKADLVVLSCCETGIGKLHRGEGIMGINRAFLAAGARNVVYTLFKVYDDVSCELTISMFDYILQGHSYRRALRQAKLDLIARREVAPIFWSGFLLLGD